MDDLVNLLMNIDFEIIFAILKVLYYFASKNKKQKQQKKYEHNISKTSFKFGKLEFNNEEENIISYVDDNDSPSANHYNYPRGLTSFFYVLKLINTLNLSSICCMSINI